MSLYGWPDLVSNQAWPGKNLVETALGQAGFCFETTPGFTIWLYTAFFKGSTRVAY